MNNSAPIPKNHLAVPLIVFEDAITRLTPSQFKLYMFIFRYTYKLETMTSEPTPISMVDFELGYNNYVGKMTPRVGLSNPTIQRGLAYLCDNGWITRQREAPRKYLYAINFEKINS